MGFIRIRGDIEGALTISGSYMAGNQMDSATYISGSMLRGALAAHWLQTLGAPDDSFLNYFCRGRISFVGLFPVPSGDDGIDFLGNSYEAPSSYFPYPMPLSTFTCKYSPEGGHGYVNGVLSRKSACEASGCGAPLKQCKSPEFYYMKENQVAAIEQKKELYLYHGADRELKRAKDAALYAYASIGDGERFLGWLYGKDEDLNAFAETLLPEKVYPRDDNGRTVFHLYFGRGRKRRGYLKAVMDSPDTDSFTPPIQPDGSFLSVVFQTPGILYDALFHPKTMLTPADVFCDLAERLDIQPVEHGAFARTTLVEGWSGVHRLPRMPEQAISKGSTFLFRVNKDLNEQEKSELLAHLENAQQQGIGERRSEGYGRVLFNTPLTRMGG